MDKLPKAWSKSSNKAGAKLKRLVSGFECSSKMVVIWKAGYPVLITGPLGSFWKWSGSYLRRQTNAKTRKTFTSSRSWLATLISHVLFYPGSYHDWHSSWLFSWAVDHLISTDVFMCGWPPPSSQLNKYFGIDYQLPSELPGSVSFWLWLSRAQKVRYVWSPLSFWICSDSFKNHLHH